MSGHSKWAQIKHKKAAADAKRGVAFGKFARAITIAARDNPDPNTNIRLKGEIERARAMNMPMDNIERAIKRVSEKDAATLNEITVELIGPGNTGVIVRAITDNANRTMGDLKRIASTHGTHLAGQGAVLWMFRRVGVLHLLAVKDADAVQLAAIDAGADEVEMEDGEIIALCPPERFDAVRESLGNRVTSASLELTPTTTVTISPDQERQLNALRNDLDALDDVQDIWTNEEQP